MANTLTSNPAPAAPVDALVTPTQADRDAFAALEEAFPPHMGGEVFRDGIADEHPGVQAFAHHRIAAEKRAERRGYQAATERAAGTQEPFGYWVEQKHAEPVLLRKPAYIPEPSEICTVTPLYSAPMGQTQ